MDGLQESDSVAVDKGVCPNCGSSDANVIYSDGHSFCFSCKAYNHGDSVNSGGIPKPTVEGAYVPVMGEYTELTKRGLTEATCRKWGYQTGVFNGKHVQIANYRDSDGSVSAQKIRFANKDFLFLGDGRKGSPLYGQHLWRDAGRKVVITEGELDAMSVSQLQNHKWPVVSISGGAPNAHKCIRKAIEWLSNFEDVILMFDQDEPGQKAAKECAALLPPGKAKIASLPLKDASDMLVAGRGAELIDAIWGAKSFRPDGIVAGTELWGEIIKPVTELGIAYPFTGMNELTKGMRLGEIVTFCAGTGIGKSQICREIAHHILQTTQDIVGYVALEENNRKTALGQMSLAMNKRLHLLDPATLPEDELRKAFDETVGSGRFFTYDHFGSMDSQNLLNRIRFLVVGCGCKWIVLDHISIVISGMEGGDERRQLDKVMTDLRSLVEELKFGLIVVSHLKRPDGKGHEEGALTSLSQLRGSASIGQLSDMVIGLERNQQDLANKNKTNVRVLKNRFTGETGLATTLDFDQDTGRLTDVGLQLATEESGFKDETADHKDF